MSKRSSSQADQIGLIPRVQYLYALMGLHLKRLRSPSTFDSVKNDLAFYDAMLQKHSNRRLSSSTVLEIGYGQRPFRLIALNWIGANAFGIDLDEPVYILTIPTTFRLIRNNGAIRALKSVVRRIVFDQREYAKLANTLEADYGPGRAFNPAVLISGDASKANSYDQIPGTIDFMLSEEVFQHVPATDIPAILSLIAERMSAGGVAIVSSTIFTGIFGGHDLDWYPDRLRDDLIGRTPPWGHLTGEARQVDAYLNRLTRREYRSLFETHFDIVEEIEIYPNAGAHLLTDTVRARLSEYTDEDLLSNRVRFVLKKR